MQGQQKERWKELCELAAQEQNPERLMELVAEIDRLLEQKEQRLIAARKQLAVQDSDPIAEQISSTRSLSHGAKK